MDGEALRDDATPVVDEGGGIDVDMGLGIDMDIGRGWFSTRRSWRASCSRVRGTCACEEGGPRGEGEVDGGEALGGRGEAEAEGLWDCGEGLGVGLRCERERVLRACVRACVRRNQRAQTGFK